MTPIDIEDFESGTSSVYEAKDRLEVAVACTRHIIDAENILVPVAVKYSRKQGSYHRRKQGRHTILYGAGTFCKEPSSYVYVVKDGLVYKSPGCRLEAMLVYTAVVLEETAHLLQTLNHGRFYGSVHNAEFAKWYMYLWNKYGEWVLNEFKKGTWY